MRFKPVPEPPADLETVADVRAAVPATTAAAADCEDCCARLVDRTSLEHRDEASTWLAFLRALELATETKAGFVRTDRELEEATLQRAFRERVYGADRVLGTLEAADEALDAETVAERVRMRPQAGDSAGRTDGTAGEGGRVERLLEWAVLLEVADRIPDGGRISYETA